ncbi:MAG: transposase [Planctomycetes bacterium]|nr:transposase [Planctomycetota bacterium]
MSRSRTRRRSRRRAGSPSPARRRGKPTDNGLIEAFNGRLRAEYLNENWFLSLDDAREKVESWRRHYNGDRPHSALGYLAPEEFAARSSQNQRTG